MYLFTELVDCRGNSFCLSNLQIQPKTEQLPLRMGTGWRMSSSSSLSTVCHLLLPLCLIFVALLAVPKHDCWTFVVLLTFSFSTILFLLHRFLQIFFRFITFSSFKFFLLSFFVFLVLFFTFSSVVFTTSFDSSSFSSSSSFHLFLSLFCLHLHVHLILQLLLHFLFVFQNTFISARCLLLYLLRSHLFQHLRLLCLLMLFFFSCFFIFCIVISSHSSILSGLLELQLLLFSFFCSFIFLSFTFIIFFFSFLFLFFIVMYLHVPPILSGLIELLGLI